MTSLLLKFFGYFRPGLAGLIVVHSSALGE